MKARDKCEAGHEVPTWQGTLIALRVQLKMMIGRYRLPDAL